MKALWEILMLLGCLLMGAGCSGKEGDEPAVPAPGVASHYLSLTISLNTSSLTRAGDDEDPEGRLPGTAEENNIDNLTLFFLRNPAADEATSDLNFTAALYIDFKDGSATQGVEVSSSGGGDKKTVVIRLKDGTLPSDVASHSIIAVANAGDLSDISSTGIPSLYALRRRVAERSWADIAGEGIRKTSFSMSSFNATTGAITSPIITDGHAGTKTDPYRGECELMRLAARIDICCSEGAADSYTYGKLTKNGSDTEITYTVGSGTSNTSTTGTFFLTAAKIVNAMGLPSFLVRHTSDADKATSLTEADVPLSLDYTKLLATDADDRQTSYVIDPNFVKKSPLTTETMLSSWFGATRPAEIRENRESLFSGNALTGAFIKGSDSGSRFNTSLTVGYVNENVSLAGLDPMLFATGLSIKGVFLPEAVYESADGENPVMAADYDRGDDFWHFSPTDTELPDIFFSSEEGAEAYRSQHPGRITHHPGGVSYYHLFIRHASPNDYKPELDYVMEHAIVRNNVYRILLNFHGPGSDIPFKTDEPDDITWEIFTRPWNVRWHPVIEI